MSSDTVFTAIRTIDAAYSIINAPGRILYVDAPLEVRYERSVSRARTDHVSMDDFIVNDQIEKYGAEDTDISLLAIRSIANKVIYNRSSEEVYKRLLKGFIEN